MGKVLVTAKIENFGDLLAANRGLAPLESVRFVEVRDALVDPGATSLSMPKSLLERLGLDFVRIGQARTSSGRAEVRVFGPARLTVNGRECPCDVTELPDDCPVLIGQIPLESMDFVVDPVNQQLIGNPAHGGEHIMELY